MKEGVCLVLYCIVFLGFSVPFFEGDGLEIRNGDFMVSVRLVRM